MDPTWCRMKMRLPCRKALQRVAEGMRRHWAVRLGMPHSLVAEEEHRREVAMVELRTELGEGKEHRKAVVHTVGQREERRLEVHRHCKVGFGLGMRTAERRKGCGKERRRAEEVGSRLVHLLEEGIVGELGTAVWERSRSNHPAVAAVDRPLVEEEEHHRAVEHQGEGTVAVGSDSKEVAGGLSIVTLLDGLFGS